MEVVHTGPDPVPLNILLLILMEEEQNPVSAFREEGQIAAITHSLSKGHHCTLIRL